MTLYPRPCSQCQPQFDENIRLTAEVAKLTEMLEGSLSAMTMKLAAEIWRVNFLKDVMRKAIIYLEAGSELLAKNTLIETLGHTESPTKDTT